MKLYVSQKVEDRGLRMRTHPGFNGRIITILQAGEKLDTLDEDNIVQARLGIYNQWLHVKKSDGQFGYCAAWLLLEPGAPPLVKPLGNLSPDTRLQQNPELRLLPKRPVSPYQTIQPGGTLSSELSPLSALQSQFSSQTLVTSSELTPLPAQQLNPEILEIIPILETPGLPTEIAPVQLPQPSTTLIHDVPIFSQDDLYGNAACSPVSACMLLEYYHRLDPLNRTVTPRQLIGMLDPGDGTPGKGMSLSNVTDELLSLGYQHISEKIHARLDDLKTELIKGPLIVTVGVTLAGQGPRLIQGPGNTIHAMVVKGFSPDTIIVNDPWTGKELRFPEGTFEIMWKLGLNGMYMIRP